MSVTRNWQKRRPFARNWRTQVSISNDHTLKSRVKGNFHARFGIGGGEGDLSADHTKNNGWRELRIISGRRAKQVWISSLLIGRIRVDSRYFDLLHKPFYALNVDSCPLTILAHDPGYVFGHCWRNLSVSL